jgi:hypothetical protein
MNKDFQNFFEIRDKLKYKISKYTTKDSPSLREKMIDMNICYMNRPFTWIFMQYFGNLDRFIQFAKTSKKIIVISFVISLLYNTVGLFYAVQGNLSPVIAAILMPISSISIVLFTTIATAISAKINL